MPWKASCSVDDGLESRDVRHEGLQHGGFELLAQLSAPVQSESIPDLSADSVPSCDLLVILVQLIHDLF